MIIDLQDEQVDKIVKEWLIQYSKWIDPNMHHPGDIAWWEDMQDLCKDLLIHNFNHVS